MSDRSLPELATDVPPLETVKMRNKQVELTVENEALHLIDLIEREEAHWRRHVRYAAWIWAALRTLMIGSPWVTSIVSIAAAVSHRQDLGWITAAMASLTAASSLTMSQSYIFDYWRLRAAGLSALEDLCIRTRKSYAECENPADYAVVIESTREEFRRFKDSFRIEVMRVFAIQTSSSLDSEQVAALRPSEPTHLPRSNPQ